MKSDFKFDALKACKKEVDSAADASAKAEAEVILAEDNLTTAKRDDGSIDPEELVKRTDAAERIVKIRRIEANRVAAKLEEVEGEFHRLAAGSVEPVILLLQTKSEKEKERIGAAMKELLGEHACAGHEFRMLLGQADSIMRVTGHVQAINRAKIEVGQGFVTSPAQLADLVLAAEGLL